MEALFAISGLVVGFVAGRFLYQRYFAGQEMGAKARRDEILRGAGEESERVVKEAEIRARDEIVTRREEFEKEAEKERREIREESAVRIV